MDLLIKNKKIKIYGTADLLFVDNKMLNIRKITYLKSKLEIFGSSIFDFLKYLFSAGFIVLVGRFIYSYFSNEQMRIYLFNVDETIYDSS